MSLYARIATALGWSEQEAQSLSLQALRELVRPVDTKLAHEIDLVVQSGEVIRHPVSRAAKERHCDLMRQGFMKRQSRR